ncbi:GNAT family N-acetyltransferase [Allomuricauda sp. R78024]|uniref:GNAT family N-acetyltransferase n=1 Tax=Allomuricauda sp. R78024 TaxID=3093867 RepID=UPI0037C90DB7
MNLKTRISWFRDKIKYGLFLFGLRNRLKKIGLDICIEYLEVEDVLKIEEPIIPMDSDTYAIEFLNKEDMVIVGEKSNVGNVQKLCKGFDKGQTCIGVKQNQEIAAFMFIEYNTIDFRHKRVDLKEDEAYLLNMFTLNGHRGKNLAPYLRYHSYAFLRKRGVNKIYSITDYFNKSSLKFKKKLKAQHAKLYWTVVFFRKYKRGGVLKTF